MKYLWTVAVLVALMGANVRADDAKPADAKPADAKPADAPKDAAKPAGVDVTKTGTLSLPNADDKTIVAVMHTVDPNSVGKKPKKKNKNAGEPSQTISLIASGDLATQLKDFLNKNSTVEVNGSLADDKLTVTGVKEAPEAPKKKKKNQ